MRAEEPVERRKELAEREVVGEEDLVDEVNFALDAGRRPPPAIARTSSANSQSTRVRANHNSSEPGNH